MDDLPYTKREQDEYRREVLSTLQRIEIQTTTTNGKVADLQRWRFYITGGLAVLSTTVVPVLVWALWVLVNLPK